MRRAALLCSLLACTAEPDGSLIGGSRNPTCMAGVSAGEVATPEHVRRIPAGTGWFAGPLIADLDGDGRRELVVGTYDVEVFDGTGMRLAGADGGDRVYAPVVVADLDGDGTTEIAAGRGPRVEVWGYARGALVERPGWPADTTTGRRAEVRGLAAADLDGDGTIELVATTTQTTPTGEGGAQVFAWSADGRPFQPPGAPVPAWPRYDALAGAGHDADRNGAGHHGYGCYGLNVAIGELDDDREAEIVVTYDNHHIQLFDHDGVAKDLAGRFTNRASEHEGRRVTWGQIIRWADPDVDERHHVRHEGEWPHPTRDEWLQWTASPPLVADLDGDGVREVVGAPNIERGEPYVTQAYAVMVLEGHHDGGRRSGERKPGWEPLYRGRPPVRVEGDYPPLGVPSPVAVDLQGDARLEVVISLGDGFVHAVDAGGAPLWRFNFRRGARVRFASEPVIADLNQDGSPEVVFSTYGPPGDRGAGRLFVLGADGGLLHDLPLPDPGDNGNGSGAAAAPAVGDLDGDGALEIVVQTFDHGLDVFTVPGSAEGCLPWPTARGGPLRAGRAP